MGDGMDADSTPPCPTTRSVFWCDLHLSFCCSPRFPSPVILAKPSSQPIKPWHMQSPGFHLVQRSLGFLTFFDFFDPVSRASVIAIPTSLSDAVSLQFRPRSLTSRSEVVAGRCLLIPLPFPPARMGSDAHWHTHTHTRPAKQPDTTHAHALAHTRAHALSRTVSSSARRSQKVPDNQAHPHCLLRPPLRPDCRPSQRA